MPGEAYRRTRDALATLVSERAATRVLDVALRRSHASAEDLDARSVRHLLLGPVQRELEGILPRTGLRRTMRRLARQVSDEIRADGLLPRASALVHGDDAATPLRPVTQSSVYLPDAAPELHAAAQERSASVPSRPQRAPASSTAGTAVAMAERAADAPAGDAGAERGSSKPPTVVPHPLGAEILDAMTVRFAEIDGVQQVMALPTAAPPQVRGDGIEADELAPLAQSAIRLLGRFGPLRSLVVEHASGLLFVFPLGRDAIAVLTRANVNLGAVFAARAALEEGP